MRPIDRFTLAPTGDDASESALKDGDRVFAERIPGRALEGQYALEQQGKALYLVLTSYDVPHEEILHATLLGEEGNLLDGVELGAPLTPGVFKDARVTAPDTLAFDFQGPAMLTVHERPQGLFRRHRLQIRRSER